MNSIAIGKHIKWTLKSPSETGYVADEFYDYIRNINDEFIITENSYIEGTVIYSSFGSAVVKISDMTPEMFPFTLFCNEVKNRFPDQPDLIQQRFINDLEIGPMNIKGFSIDHQFCKSWQVFLNLPIDFIPGKSINRRSHL